MGNGLRRLRRSAGARPAAWCRAAALGVLVVGAVGGVAAWRAVDRLDEAWARRAVLQGEMADVEATVGARLEEAEGRVGLDAGFSPDDAALRAELDDLARWSGTDHDELVDEVVARDAELLASVEASGVTDERLVNALHDSLRRLDQAVVRPATGEAGDAHAAARRVVAVVAALTVALGAAAAWFARR